MTAEHGRDKQSVSPPPPIMGYVEGFIATTATLVEGHQPFTRARLEELRDRIFDQPWLYPPRQDSGELMGRVAWSEVVPVGNGFGLWARTEFYRREALQLISAGILGLLDVLPKPQVSPKETH